MDALKENEFGSSWSGQFWLRYRRESSILHLYISHIININDLFSFLNKKVSSLLKLLDQKDEWGKKKEKKSGIYWLGCLP